MTISLTSLKFNLSSTSPIVDILVVPMMTSSTRMPKSDPKSENLPASYLLLASANFLAISTEFHARSYSMCDYKLSKSSYLDMYFSMAAR